MAFYHELQHCFLNQFMCKGPLFKVCRRWTSRPLNSIFGFLKFCIGYKDHHFAEFNIRLMFLHNTVLSLRGEEAGFYGMKKLDFTGWRSWILRDEEAGLMALQNPKGWGRIVFGADPIGISVHCQSVHYFLNQLMDFDQTCIVTLLEEGTIWLDFGDLDLFLRSQWYFGWRWRLLSFLCIIFWTNWWNFDQTCIDTLLGGGKELLRFWWPWPYIQGHSGTLKCPQYGFHALSSELVDAFWPNLYRYIIGRRERVD